MSSYLSCGKACASSDPGFQTFATAARVDVGGLQPRVARGVCKLDAKAQGAGHHGRAGQAPGAVTDDAERAPGEVSAARRAHRTQVARSVEVSGGSLQRQPALLDALQERLNVDVETRAVSVARCFVNDAPKRDAYVVLVLQLDGEAVRLATSAEDAFVDYINGRRCVSCVLFGQRLVTTLEPLIVAHATCTQRGVAVLGVELNKLVYDELCGSLRHCVL